MLKKTIRRLGALAMVLAMAVSVFAVNASAVDGEQKPTTVSSITINKTVTSTNETYANGETFNFTITPAEPAEGSNMYKGIEGGVDATANITISKGENDTASTTHTGSATVSLHAGAFVVDGKPAPGIYRYEIKETAGSNGDMMYDNSTKYLDVYVNSEGQIFAAVIEGKGTDKSAADFNNTITTKQLTIKKQVTGALGNKTKDFSFKVKIDANADGEIYKIVKKVGDSETVLTDVTAGQDYSFTLKDGESVVIYGLSKSDKFTVVETDAGQDGYLTSYALDNTAVNEVKEVSMANGTGADAVAADKAVTVTNDKDTTTPGGVIMTIAPYALMVVLAGAFAVGFLTRRNRAE